jgi:acetoin utilization deacetylase AcuC-like enzyme
MKIVYNNSYNNHKVLDSSFESSDRLNYLLKNIQSKYLIEFIEQLNLNDIKPYLNLKILDNIQKIYENLDYWNCQICSFKNQNGLKKCEICDSENKDNLKQISKIESDTTVYSKDTQKTLLNNILTICYAVEYSLRYKEDIFLAIRPPGHHSNCSCETINHDIGGFCIINNVSIAVDYLKYKYNSKKIAIVDWDVHHGNGTQQIYYHRDDVLFIDIHRYGNNFYPKTGSLEEKGKDKGLGYTINIPLEKESEEDTYLEKFKEIIIPSLQNYNPDWILVSSGFDAHKNDPLGGMKLESTSYKKFYNLLKGLDKNIILFLEGGYNKESICESVNVLLN